MPWSVKESDGRYCVYKKGSSTPVPGGCHDTKEEAERHRRALYAAEGQSGRKYSTLAFSDDLLVDTEEDNVKWIQAWRYSKWEHPSYGTVEITPETGARFKQHFENKVLGRDHLINYNHGGDPAKGGKAAGKILSIEPRDSGIFYKVRFTDNALQEIRDGEWLYVSPEYDDWLNPETGETFEDMPFDLALTNTPFFKGMPPLNFSEFVNPDEPKDFVEWSTSYKNDLPDSAFLFIESGGKKDSEGKTEPRSLRHLPVKDASGKIDLPHLRNAISRLEQPKTGKGWLSDSLRASLLSKARKMLTNAGGSPKGGTVDELLVKFAQKLGIDLEEDMSEDQILKAAENLNETIEPLRRAKVEGARQRTFREAFPEEYKKMRELEATRIESDARSFAESYERFTIKDGDNRWKSSFGFSQLVIDEIAEVHRKFSEKSATHGDLKRLLDLIGDKGIVDYSEAGSSRTPDGKPRSEDPKLAFSEAVQEVMEEDDLEYEAAIHVASLKFPELYDSYLRAVPQR